MAQPEIVFMGTPAFAVPTLLALLEAGYPIRLVVTQPDKPVGRKQILTPPPIKRVAQEHNLSVFQPARIKKDPHVLERLAAAEAEIFVVIAYGKILPQAMLDLPRLGCINVHASLLPFYRGAAPIQWSIVRGETETGITTMLMDAGMDTGDILLQDRIPILAEDTGASLAEKLSRLGAGTLLKTIPPYIAGQLRPQAQEPSKATYAPMLNKTDGLISWQRPVRDIFNLIRGLQPWPEAYTYFRDKTLKIKAAQVLTENSSDKGVPGQVLQADHNGIQVQTGQGLLNLQQVHYAGSREMSAAEFARGQRLEGGHIFADTLVC